jgi:hypothetical protein
MTMVLAPLRGSGRSERKEEVPAADEPADEPAAEE